MRQIADVRAGALDDLAVGVDQRVGLARQRRDLKRELPFQPLRGPAADRGQALGDPLERRKAKPHLEHGREQERDDQRAERDDEDAVEGARLLLDLLRVAGNPDEIASVVAEIDGALDQAQPLIFRPVHIGPTGAVGGERRVLIARMRQAAVPQRARGAHLGLGGVELGDLPIPAR